MKFDTKAEQVAIAMYNALADHGISSHYLTIAKLVKTENPGLDITEGRVKSILGQRRDMFRRVGRGIYFLQGKREGRTYPHYD